MSSKTPKEAESRQEAPKIDNSQLVQAMIDVGNAGTALNWSRVYRLLMESSLVIPVAEVPQMRKPEGGETTEVDISLVRLADEQGRALTLAFTDEEALRNWNTEVRALSLKGRQFFQMLRGSEIAAILINLYDPANKPIRPGGRLTRFEFDALGQGLIPSRPDASGTIHMTATEEKQIIVTPPSRMLTEEILQPLRMTARIMPGLNELYFFELQFEGEEPHDAIGVELSPHVPMESWKPITQNLGRSIHGKLEGKKFLEFVKVEGPLGDAIKKKGKKLLNEES
jgi:hypothetical protein